MPKRLFIILAIAIIALAPLNALGGGYLDYLAEIEIDSRRELSNNRLIDVPGRGKLLFYAQNNPFWSDMRYEAKGSRSFRRFGAGGCCPTSAAIAFVNLMTKEQLAALRHHASEHTKGYGVSTNSMNPANTNSGEGVYWFERAQDYEDFLPLVFGSFAAGNNSMGRSWRVRPAVRGVSSGGTSPGFIPELARIYGVTLTEFTGKGNDDFFPMIKNGALAIALANSTSQPFVNASAHYVVVAHVDDEYIYILDPQDKASYRNTDKKKVLEVVCPGLVRAKLENFYYCYFSRVYVLSPP